MKHHTGSQNDGHYTCSVQNCHDRTWSLIDDNLFESIPETSFHLLTSSKNYLVFLQRKGLKQIPSQAFNSNWPYSSELIKKLIAGKSDGKIPFGDRSTMSKDVSRSHSLSSEGGHKWTKVFVPEEKPSHFVAEKGKLSILEEECSSIHTEQ